MSYRQKLKEAIFKVPKSIPKDDSSIFHAQNVHSGLYA